MFKIIDRNGFDDEVKVEGCDGRAPSTWRGRRDAEKRDCAIGLIEDNPARRKMSKVVYPGDFGASSTP